MLIIVFSFTGCGTETSKSKDINIVFRFDDPSELSSTDIELQVITAFKKHNVPVTFGVIPFKCAGSTRDTSPQKLIPLSLQKALFLKKYVDEGIVYLAMHGYSHQMIESEIWTEFSGLDYKSQFEKLEKGKNYLEKIIGKDIHTFIPPYNTYDSNTIKALEALDFSILSAGIRIGSADSEKLNFIPMTIRLHQIKDAVRKARVSSDRNPLIVIMFHEYDFKDTSIKGIENRAITIEDLNGYLSWIQSQNDTRIISITQAKKQIDTLNAKRLKLINNFYLIKSIVPSFLTRSLSVYPEYSSLLSVLIKAAIIYISIFIVTVLLCFYIICLILKWYPKLLRAIVFGIVISSVIVIGYSTYDGMHTRGLAMIIISLGSIFALGICFIRDRRTNKDA